MVREYRQPEDPGSPYFRYSSFWASKPKQAAQMTGLLMPTASPAVLRFAALRPNGWLRGRASQMTGRCVGGACMRPLLTAGQSPFVTPVTRPRSTPTGDYPPSRCFPWRAAGVALPSLRTVRAVLPHTALQKIVSSSGLARSAMGFIQSEKPKVCEVGIGPPSVVRIAPAHPRPFVLLAQDSP